MVLMPNFPIASPDALLPGFVDEINAKILNIVITRLIKKIMKFEDIIRNDAEIKVNVSMIMVLVKSPS